MARKSRKQTAAPMPAPSLYVHVALYIRLSVEDNKKRGCSVENQKLVLNDFLSNKPDFVVYDTYIDGYGKPSNFAAAFKKRYGVAPKNYRESWLDNHKNRS